MKPECVCFRANGPSFSLGRQFHPPIELSEFMTLFNKSIACKSVSAFPVFFFGLVIRDCADEGDFGEHYRLCVVGIPEETLMRICLCLLPRYIHMYNLAIKLGFSDVIM